MMRIVSLLLLAALACGDDDAPLDATVPSDAADDTAVLDASAGPLALSIVSSRPDMITGGTTLARITAVDGVLDGVALHLDDAPLAVDLHLVEGALLARIDDLPQGSHRLEATRGDETAAIEIEVHPITGPVFSGPHETPYYCTTELQGLAVAMDENCSISPAVVHFRKTNAGAWELLANPAVPPADTATAQTLGGRRVPFVGRLEVGTINRAIYWIATLYDPDATEPFEPWSRPSTWDGGAIYYFGGGCGSGYTQGDASLGLAMNDIVGTGIAWMHASLNTLNNNCNDVLSAETLMMVREHFIAEYGEPDYLMGFGGSGGSIQQHLIADNYPGLLDGILPSASYPDVWTILPDIVDCRLLYDYFDAEEARFPTEAERTAVTGFARDRTCRGWTEILGNILQPDEGCLPWVPGDAVYDRDSNPTGARCTLEDHNVNIFGRDEATGFARRAWSNVGVQYGLRALNDGDITFEQFLHLNEHVGSFDVHGDHHVAREPGDAQAFERAYATGRVLDGARLAQIPIIDVRGYNDVTIGDFHDSVRTWAIRARLARHGDTDNHVSFMGANDAATGRAGFDSLLAMDGWLRALAADPDPDRAAAARRTKPTGLGDRCYPTTTPTEGACTDVFVPHATPRMVAGGPLEGDLIRCSLRAIDATDYPTAPTAEQRARLEAVFPTGVCDWSTPPAERVAHAGPWQRF
ncbi:MAG: hypothetical protein KF901_24815 [Myxococcales bacterium]|nr:hypothetical protein [Myxococcales bacterium]